MTMINRAGLFVLTLVVACGGGGEEESAGPGPQAEGSDLLALLPADGAVSDWTREGEPRFFNADNLWELIDGAADGYISYGFEDLVTSDYSSASSGKQAVIDVYRMKDPTHAFGIYCQERSPDYEFLHVGAEGYIGGTALNFWHGPYYVKLTVFEESDELKGEMEKLARHISAKIDFPPTEPKEVGYFPEENQEPRSLQFVPQDVLGQSYLTNGFEARYAQQGREIKAVVVTAGDPDEAKADLARYKEFLSENAGPTKALAGMGEEGFAGTDSFYGTVMALRAGAKLIVVLGAPSEEVGKRLLSGILEKIQGA